MKTIDELFLEMSIMGASPLSFPFRYKTGEDYLDYLNRIFNQYSQELDNLDVNSVKQLNSSFERAIVEAGNSLNPNIQPLDFVRDAKKVMDAIWKAADYHFKGNPVEGCGIIEKCFTDNGCHLLQVAPQSSLDERVTYFKIRKGKFSDPADMYQLPFEKRGKAATARFSIAGLPILYLGESLYISWEEMGRPNLDDITFAAFRFKERPLMVDLTYPIKQDSPDLYSFFVYYPLIAASSVSVRDRNDAFKPEYCISQDFLYTVRYHGMGYFDGVRYMSTRLVRGANVNEHVFVNDALLTYGADAKEGVDQRLLKKIRMTEPICINQKLLYDVERISLTPKFSLNIDFGSIQRYAEGQNFYDLKMKGGKVVLAEGN